ncbi:phage tail protein [Comamonas thiooxydans]|uniref:phage tail assembly protein T n=1 Tax=Comamonas thiooxydans TaxID=363952 RepID=UPI00070E348C|nr:hypothetical protein [Comamonas thiooxydans]BDR10675.1 phage tail protein [Comamonas thiooxydans]
MSFDEVQSWLAFREKYGSLHLQTHIERAAATVAHTVSQTVARKKSSQAPRFEDFLPQRKGAQAAVITLEEAMREWR